MKNLKIKAIYIFIIMLILTSKFFGFDLKGVFASTTDGTIDSADKYAWSENIGWINFGTTEGNVHITDSALTGYAWSENAGWISLNCSNDSSCSTVDYKVANDGTGNLSGYAWSENTGWINFNPSGGGVSINSSGKFLGYAWGENIGWIVFNCATTNSCATVDYKVKTDWLGQNARPQCNNSTDDDGDGLTDYPNDPGCDSLTDNDETDSIVSGGIGFPPNFKDPPLNPSSSSSNPKGEFKIIINPEHPSHKITDNPIIKLKFITGNNTKMMSISQDPDFTYASLIPYEEEVYWDLEAESQKSIKSKVKNEYTIYAKFYTKYGYSTEPVSASVILLAPISNSQFPISNDQIFKPFAYSKPRLSSLSEEQNRAKELKQGLEKYYGINRIPVHRKHWHTIVNSFIYGNYPINAIIKTIKFGGKTVHPNIPFSSWKNARDYINWIDR